MSSSYNIYNWDAIKFCNTEPQPMIFIKPDKKLEKKINTNVEVIISGTNSVYDGTLITGILKSSKNTPNYRPNFFEQTGLYVILLNTHFMRYPPKLGQVEIKL